MNCPEQPKYWTEKYHYSEMALLPFQKDLDLKFSFNFPIFESTSLLGCQGSGVCPIFYVCPTKIKFCGLSICHICPEQGPHCQCLHKEILKFFAKFRPITHYAVLAHFSVVLYQFFRVFMFSCFFARIVEPKYQFLRFHNFL